MVLNNIIKPKKSLRISSKEEEGEEDDDDDADNGTCNICSILLAKLKIQINILIK
jgi:hypothetical protein